MFSRCCSIDKKKIIPQIILMCFTVFLYMSHSPALDSLLSIILPFRTAFDFSYFLSFIVMVWNLLVWLFVLDFFIFIFKIAYKRIKINIKNNFKRNSLKNKLFDNKIYITQSKFLCWKIYFIFKSWFLNIYKLIKNLKFIICESMIFYNIWKHDIMLIYCFISTYSHINIIWYLQI